MPTQANSGIAPVCDGILTQETNGTLTCSVAWEYVDISVFGVFDPSVLDANDLGLMFFTGWAALMTLLATNYGFGKLVHFINRN